MKNLLGQVVWNKLTEFLPIYEIKLKIGYPLTVYNQTGMHELGVVEKDYFDGFLARASDNSVYAVAERMKDGYFNYGKGIRIGLGGEYVVENGKILSLININSAVVRVSHEVLDCSARINKENLFKNVLVVSPPCGGKTTFLRDLARRSSQSKKTVILDERRELSGDNALDVGSSVVLLGLSKKIAYVNAIRALSPEIIVTDELIGTEEYSTVADVLRSGVKVYASFHSDDLDKLPTSLRIFDIYVLLSTSPVGKIREIRYG